MGKEKNQSQEITGLHQIAEQFDVLVTDQFGVLHDGQQVYSGVIDCLHILKDKGIRIAALSNSGRRSEANCLRLQEFGFAADLFDVVLTSGELAWLTLKDRELDFLSQDSQVFLISGTGKSNILDSLGYSITSDATDADFVLITGADQQRHDIQYYQEVLQPAMQSQLPCICANPDVHTLQNGSVTYGPASIAEYYATSGAQVLYFGKPHLPIYRKLLSLLELSDGQFDPTRILCVGDSPAHDIKGAQSAGLSSALVLTGLQSMQQSVRHEGAAVADFTLPGLIW